MLKKRESNFFKSPECTVVLINRNFHCKYSNTVCSYKLELVFLTSVSLKKGYIF